MAEPKCLRILLADDHVTVRHGLKLLVESQDDMEVVAEASDGAAAVQLAMECRPDVVVMDVSMPGMNGLVATQTLRRMLPSAAIVTLTRHADDAYLRGGAAFQKGCGSVGFSKLLYDAVRGAGARGDDGCVASRRDVGAQHREDLGLKVWVGLRPACRRRRPDVELQPGLVGKLRERPPRVPACARARPSVIQLDEPRRTERLDVDRHVTADRGRRPRGFKELAAGLYQVGRTRADLFRIADQQRGARRKVIGQCRQLACAQ